MSLPPLPNTSYSIELLNELNRDLIRAAPNDPLQFCSAWFQYKLEQDRLQSRLTHNNNHHNTNNHTINPSIYPPPPPPLTHQINPFNPIHPQLPSNYYQPYPYSFIYPHHPSHHPLNHLSTQTHPQPSQPNLNHQIQTIEPQSYHSSYPSNHPIYSHSPYQHYHHHQHHQQQQPQSNHQLFSFNQPPPNNFPTINPSTIPTSAPSSSIHHSLPNPAIPSQQSIPQNESRSYSFATSNSLQSINPVETPSRPTNLNRQAQTLTSPATYSSPTSQPRLPNQNTDHNQLSLSSPNRSLDSPAPTYNSQTTASPNHPPSSRSPAQTRFNRPNHSQDSSSPTLHRLSPSNHRSSVPPVEEESDSSSSDEGSNEPIVPAGYNFGRRVSVSAESLSPSSRSNGPVAPKVVIPKTVDQRKRIEASIKGNLLFRNLDEEQHNDVLNAMTEVRVSQGTEVIVQGAVGDFFYVVEQGTFDVYVRGPPTYTYVPPSSNQSQGTLSLGVNNDPSNGAMGSMTNPFAPGLNRIPSSQDLGSSIQRASTPLGTSNSTGGTTLTHQAPSKKVHSYGPGGSFGELALMYNAPRAATVVATSPTATLWALDRVTFRSILIEHTARKRRMYENFLAEVPILVSLSPTEISKIADSLEERSFAEGVDVIKEGEVGREFFIIESGRAEVYKKRNNGDSETGEEELVGILGKGDHFGELALLNSAPRAATVRAASGTGRLRVAALGEKAFTRLLGPVIDILSRHAESHYGKISNTRPVATGSNAVGPNSVSINSTNGHHEAGTSPAIVNGNGSTDHSPLSSSLPILPLPPSSTNASSATSTPNPMSNNNNSTLPSATHNFAHWNGLANNPPPSIGIPGSGAGTTGVNEDGK